MKYDVTIDPDNTGTSHGLVVELVGTGKRVLDVGCSTGYLAEALAQRGNKTAGVGVDPESAEVARSRVGQVIVGDVETMDLVDHFGEGSFDAVVFADVLEHLRNPLGVLRRARALLSDTGFVVVSIPNVAHGAVRLALLQGRFDYRTKGLLDSTHLRFFTRSTVEDLLRGAGFVITDIRRTHAGPFEVEIPLNPGDFDAGTLEEVDRDPESTTYQFVVRAVPIGSVSADVAMVDDLVAKTEEIERLRSELGAIAQRLGSTPYAPRLGVIVVGAPSPIARLRVGALRAEMTWRLPGFDFRFYRLVEEPETIGPGGESAQALLPWSHERAVGMLAELDAALVVCPSEVDPDVVLQEILADLSGSGLPLHLVPTDLLKGPTGEEAAREWWSRPSASAGDVFTDHPGFGPKIVDPAALGGRLFAPHLLSRRLDYLRVIEKRQTAGPFIVVSLESAPVGDTGSLWTAIARAGHRLEAEIIVVASNGGTPTWVSALGDVEPIDLVAFTSGAAVVISDTPAMMTLARALATPVLGVIVGQTSSNGVFVEWARSQGYAVASGEDLDAAVEASMTGGGADRVVPQLTELEVFLDGLADAVTSSAGRRIVQSVPQRLDELSAQAGVLEAANDGLREALAREREAFASRAHAYIQPDPQSGEVVRMRHSLRESIDEIARLRFELEAVYGTRTMRTLQPARRVYSKLRSLRR